MRKSHSAYKIGLGRPFLDRASLIFILFILITFAFGGSAVYAEYKTGQLNEKFIKPVQRFIYEVIKSVDDTDAPKNLTNPNVLISTSSATIKIETNPKTTNTTTTITYPKPIPTATPTSTSIKYESDTKSYEQRVKEMNEKADAAYQEALKKQAEWSSQKQQENQQWFEQTSQQNAATVKASYDEAVKKMQEEAEAWKKAHGF